MSPQSSQHSKDTFAQLRLYAAIAAIAWLTVVCSSFYWNLFEHDRVTLHDTISRMTSSIERTLLETRWDKSHAEIPVTFFRHDFQGNELLRKKFGTPIGSGLAVRARLVSLLPSGNKTAPDAWEKTALEKVHSSNGEITAVVPVNGVPHLRMLREVRFSKDCLRCHSAMRAGMSGGISVSIPMEVLSLMQRKRTLLVAETHCFLALIGLILVATGYRGLLMTRKQLLEAVRQRENAIAELQQALAEIKTLSGIIPICASCKKIRDDKGYWSQVEKYVQERSQASFSHGICPDCARKLYPDYSD